MLPLPKNRDMENTPMKEQTETITNNWVTAMKEDPEQTKNVIRGMLDEPGKRALLEKSLRNRGFRWSLKKMKALRTVEDELEKAKNRASKETQ